LASPANEHQIKDKILRAFYSASSLFDFMIKLILTRHGHVEGINPERFRGRTDLAVTQLGRVQAQTLGRYVATSWRPDAIYSSPLARCIATAQEIATACRMALQSLADLNDLDYGGWQWETYDAVRSKWPTEYETWLSAPHLFRFPGGESLQDLIARTANVLRMVIVSHSSGNQTIVLVGHDSVNRALLLRLLEQPLTAYRQIVQSPCSISEIHIEGSHVKVQSVNETQHLSATSD
jgi:probable phosphoglycerate mutase